MRPRAEGSAAAIERWSGRAAAVRQVPLVTAVEEGRCQRQLQGAKQEKTHILCDIHFGQERRTHHTEPQLRLHGRVGAGRQ